MLILSGIKYDLPCLKLYFSFHLFSKSITFLPPKNFSPGPPIKADKTSDSNTFVTELISFLEIVFLLIASSFFGIALFGFTLSYDELARSSQVMGSGNTLPLELRGLTTTVTTPIIYALGTVTTFVSFCVITVSIGFYLLLKKKKGL